MTFDTIRVEDGVAFMPIKSPDLVVVKALGAQVYVKRHYLDRRPVITQPWSMKGPPYGKACHKIILSLTVINGQHLLRPMFLAINGLEIVATDAESQDFILGLLALR